MDVQKTKTLLEYCEEVGFKNPLQMSRQNFTNMIELYESAYKHKVPTYIEGRYLHYVCPVSGEFIRKMKLPKEFIVPKILLEDIKLIDQVDEIRQSNKGVKTVINEHTTKLFADLTKAQGQLLSRLIGGLVSSNSGVVSFSDRDDYKLFKRHLDYFLNNNIIIPVDNELSNGQHFSYRLAPYIAFKGNESLYQSLLTSWFSQVARITARRIHPDFPVIDPMSRKRDNFSQETL